MKYSWIKMNEKPTLESLRQTMYFPNLRVKTCFEEDLSHINKLPDIWIESLSVKDLKILGNKPLEVRFSPQLTTIVGGRGSGKSTIIRLLTGIFSRSSLERLEEIYKEFSDFYSIKDGVLTNSTEISVNIYKNNILYKVNVTEIGKNNSKVVIKKYDKEINEFVESENNIEDLFRVDIYNQKQIYKLAQNTNALREKLDSMIPDIDNIKKDASNNISIYKSKMAKIKDIEFRLKQKKKLRVELNDISEKISLFKDTEIKEEIEKSETFKKQRLLLKDINESFKNKIDLIENLQVQLKDYNIEFNSNEFIEPHKSEIEGIVNKTKVEIEKKELLLADILTSFREGKERYTESITGTNWNKQRIKFEKIYKDKLEILESKNIHVKEVDILLKEQEKKNAQLNQLTNLDLKLEEEYKNLNEIKKNYIKNRTEISQKRTDFIADLLKNTNIKIKINRFRDKQDFIKRLREIIQRPSGFNEDISKIADQCFAGDINKLIEEFKQNVITVKNNRENLYSAKFNNVIASLNDEQISEIQLLLQEDDISIEYKPDGQSSFKSLKNTSAGQRTSAILTFILSDGKTPLVLDQPEDDLDNHVIYDLVVERIKHSKENRQIVVVTHNANIPVNGDAELIIAMNSGTSNIEIFNTGTLEEEVIREEICNVMEGGEKAFKMRASRYSIK